LTQYVVYDIIYTNNILLLQPFNDSLKGKQV